MNKELTEIKEKVFDKCSLLISDFEIESESKEYDACRFKLNRLNIIYRKSKITPKKIGQFVTFWKRVDNGPIEPFHETDSIDFYLINIRAENQFGQFVFPKSILIKKGIISTNQKEGKRGFRVYPPWDIAINKQAIRTQKWQLNYFIEIGEEIDLKKVRDLYSLT